MSRPRRKALRKLWARLWLSNWTSDEHLELLNRWIFSRRGK